ISRSSAASAGHRIAATADLAVFLTAVRLLPGAAGDDHADAFHVLEDGGRFTVPVGDADDDVVGVDGIVYIAQPALDRAAETGDVQRRVPVALLGDEFPAVAGDDHELHAVDRKHLVRLAEERLFRHR